MSNLFTSSDGLSLCTSPPSSLWYALSAPVRPRPTAPRRCRRPARPRSAARLPPGARSMNCSGVAKAEAGCSSVASGTLRSARPELVRVHVEGAPHRDEHGVGVHGKRAGHVPPLRLLRPTLRQRVIRDPVHQRPPGCSARAPPCCTPTGTAGAQRLRRRSPPQSRSRGSASSQTSCRSVCASTFRSSAPSIFPSPFTSIRCTTFDLRRIDNEDRRPPPHPSRPPSSGAFPKFPAMNCTQIPSAPAELGYAVVHPCPTTSCSIPSPSSQQSCLAVIFPPCATCWVMCVV